jgi:NAD+ synthase
MSAPDSSLPTVAHREARTIDATERAGVRFVTSVVEDAGADGVVVPMAGDVGSATAATLAVEALGVDAVFGLVLPTAAAGEGDERAAQRVADDLGIDFRTVDLGPVVDAFAEATTRETWLPAGPDGRRVAYDHVRARDGFDAALAGAAERLRASAARFEADSTDRLVLGTADRTDRLLGTGPAHGDGGPDLVPLGDIYRTEVRALARHLGVPEAVVRTPTDGPDGRPDEGVGDVADGTVDSVLWLLVEEGYDPEAVAAELDVDPAIVGRLAERCDDPGGRRAAPPTPATYAPEGDG